MPDPVAMLQFVQFSPHGQNVYQHEPFYKEHAYGMCSPRSGGERLSLIDVRSSRNAVGAPTIPDNRAHFEAEASVVRADATNGLSVQIVVGQLRTRRVLPKPLTMAEIRQSADELSVAARLLGPTIVPARLVSVVGRPCLPSEPSCLAVFNASLSYHVSEPGAYVLEVLLSHLMGVDLNHLLHNETLDVVTPRAPATASLRKPRHCTGAETFKGRWVRSPPNEDRLTFDEMGYNRDYRWEARTCRHREFTATRLASCFRRCGYRRISFNGDSLGREHLTNFRKVLEVRAMTDGRRYKDSMGEAIEVRLDPKSNASVYWNANFGPTSHPADVVVYTPVLVWMLAKGVPTQCVIKTVSEELQKFWAECAKKQVVCLFALPPTIQHAPWRDKFSPTSQDGTLTRRRMETVSFALKRKAASLAIPTVDAHAVSAGRWMASWDGIHYSFSVTPNASWSRFTYQWQGGVSFTSTNLLLNLLCPHDGCAKPPTRQPNSPTRQPNASAADDDAPRAEVEEPLRLVTVAHPVKGDQEKKKIPGPSCPGEQWKLIASGGYTGNICDVGGSCVVHWGQGPPPRKVSSSRCNGACHLRDPVAAAGSKRKPAPVYQRSGYVFQRSKANGRDERSSREKIHGRVLSLMSRVQAWALSQGGRRGGRNGKGGGGAKAAAGGGGGKGAGSIIRFDHGTNRRKDAEARGSGATTGIACVVSRELELKFREFQRSTSA